jgi:hypothetical protein
VTCRICGAKIECGNTFFYILYHHSDLSVPDCKISMSLNWLWMCVACTHQFFTVDIAYLKLEELNQSGSGPCALTLCTVVSQA